MKAILILLLVLPFTGFGETGKKVDNDWKKLNSSQKEAAMRSRVAEVFSRLKSGRATMAQAEKSLADAMVALESSCATAVGHMDKAREMMVMIQKETSKVDLAMKKKDAEIERLKAEVARLKAAK